MKVDFGVCMLPGFAQTAFSLARSSFPGEFDSDVGKIFLWYEFCTLFVV